MRMYTHTHIMSLPEICYVVWFSLSLTIQKLNSSVSLKWENAALHNADIA